MLISPPIPLAEKTIYFSAAMQTYMHQEIKKPALEAVDILFGAKSNLDKIKAIRKLWGAFEALRGLPEPTKENTWHPNTHNLIELRDWIWERCHLGSLRMNLIRRVINFVIIMHAWDSPWRWIFDSLIGEALKKEWKQAGYQDNWVKVGYYDAWWDKK